MDDTMRAPLLTPEIKRWRAGLGLAGAGAIADGAPLTPGERDAFGHELARAVGCIDALFAPERAAVEQFAAGARRAVAIVGNAVRPRRC